MYVCVPATQAFEKCTVRVISFSNTYARGGNAFDTLSGTILEVMEENWIGL